MAPAPRPEASEATEASEAPAPERVRKMSKQRTLEQIKSLESDDDERTGISKKVSWILRHGYQKVSVKMDADGWVNISDLLEVEILEGVTKETLMAVIVDKNAQKLRYKLKETPEGIYIKAYSKTERKATNTSWSEPERKTQGLRQEAQPFVPSSAFSQGLPQLGYPWPMAGGFGFAPMMQWPGYPMSPFTMEGSSGASPGRYVGRIKSFNAEKGFGFIECAATYAQFNRDVFLHKAQFGDMTIGTEVTFQVETNKQGMPQAKDLAPAGSGAGSGKAGRGKGKAGRGQGKAGGRGQGKGGGRAGQGARGGGADPEPGDQSTAPPAPAGDAAAAGESTAKTPGKAAATEAGAAAAAGAEASVGDS